jgi:hypothetical protein
MSDKGAKIAVQRVISFTARAMGQGRTDYAEILRDAATQAYGALTRAASQYGAQPHDLATTILGVVVAPNGAAAVQLGDGVIVVRKAQDEWCSVFWPQKGEYANVTRFLTDEDSLSHIQIDSLPEVSDVALLTDGLESLALHYASRSVFAPFFGGLFTPLLTSEGSSEILALSSELESFLSSPRVASRTDDDVSIVLATRQPFTRAQ